MAKAALNNKKTFRQQIGIKFKEETGNVLHLVYSFVWYCSFETWDSRSKIPGKF
jgi:hypothetical protein